MLQQNFVKSIMNMRTSFNRSDLTKILSCTEHQIYFPNNNKNCFQNREIIHFALFLHFNRFSSRPLVKENGFVRLGINFILIHNKRTSTIHSKSRIYKDFVNIVCTMSLCSRQLTHTTTRSPQSYTNSYTQKPNETSHPHQCEQHEFFNQQHTLEKKKKKCIPS